MALVFQEGFDSYNDRHDLTMHPRSRFLVGSWQNADYYHATDGRFGGGCIKIQENIGRIAFPLNRQLSGTTVRMAWHMRVNSAFTGSTLGSRTIMGLANSSPSLWTANSSPLAIVSPTWQMWMTSSKLQIMRFGAGSLTATWTSSMNINDNAWHHYEVEMLPANAGGSFKLWVDGVLDINFSGDTTDDATNNIANIGFVYGFGGSGVGTTADAIRYDDVIVWDDSGGSEELTGHLPDQHRISYILPDGVGDDTDFTPSAGSNFSCVNAIKTNGDTNYVEGSVSGDRDLYTMSGLGLNPQYVYSVDLELWVRKEDIGAINYKTAVKSGGVLDYGSTRNPHGGYELIREKWLNPNGDIKWTQGALESAQVGIEIV